MFWFCGTTATSSLEKWEVGNTVDANLVASDLFPEQGHFSSWCPQVNVHLLYMKTRTSLSVLSVQVHTQKFDGSVQTINSWRFTHKEPCYVPSQNDTCINTCSPAATSPSLEPLQLKTHVLEKWTLVNTSCAAPRHHYCMGHWCEWTLIHVPIFPLPWEAKYRYSLCWEC